MSSAKDKDKEPQGGYQERGGGSFQALTEQGGFCLVAVPVPSPCRVLAQHHFPQPRWKRFLGSSLYQGVRGGESYLNVAGVTKRLPLDESLNLGTPLSEPKRYV